MKRSYLFRAAKLALLMVSLAVVAGCGAPSPEDICDGIDGLHCAEWSGKEACIDDGESIQKRVDAAGTCDDAWSEYRQCLWDAKTCNFDGSCPTERADLVDCIGPL